MQNLEAFKALLEEPAKVVITTHQKPDADALGSSLALSLFLKKMGHDAKVISPTDYPDFLNWMAGHDEVLIFENGGESKSESLISKSDIIFCLDFSALSRINGLGELVKESAAKKVLIDHHLDPEGFAEFVEWDTGAAATAELLFDLIVALGKKELIDQNIAEALYAGLMTDTGSFRHSNTSQNVFKVAGELVNLGADASKVARLIYDNNSLERLKFFGFALSERLKVLKDYKAAYFAISNADLKRFRSKTGDTEGLVNYALSIAGIDLAALIIDRNGEVKLSFRSIGSFSVNDFARNHFDGGGHRNAAGGRSELTLDETVEKFESLLNNYKEELTSNSKQ